MPWGLAATALGGLFGRRSQKVDTSVNVQEAARDRDFQAKQQAGQQEFSAQQAAQQMDFQREMASTQTQRSAEDMEKAGLNRILALGSPAAAPSGAMGASGMASGSRGQAAPPQAVAGAQMGVQLASAMQAIKTQEAQEEFTRAQADHTREKTKRDATIGTVFEAGKAPADMLKDLVGSATDTGRSALQQVKSLDRAVQEQLNKLQDNVKDRWNNWDNRPSIKNWPPQRRNKPER